MSDRQDRPAIRPLPLRKSRQSGKRRPPAEPPCIDALPPEALARLSAAVATARSQAEAVRSHLAVVQDLVRARTVFVSLFDLAKNQLAVYSVRGRANAAVVVAAPGDGPVGQAFATDSLVEAGGMTAVPLRDGGRPFGVLALANARGRAAPALLQGLADHLAATIQAASLRDAAVRRTRDLETAVAGLKSLEQARDELLGNVSHELKSPLTTIKAYLSMARKERLGPLSEKMKGALEACERNADRLLRLINDLLLMSRLQGGRMKLADRPFGLRALAQEAAGTLAAGAAASKVRLQVPRTGEVFVKGDRERALEAVSHLLENAILATKPGGEVVVDVSSEGGVAVLTVRDFGVGVLPEDLEGLFEGFSPRGAGRSRGNGLGLAVVRQIIHLHGGTLTAQSAPGQGSTFTVKLPLFAGEVSAGPGPFEPRDGSILVVEDDDDCREVLGQVLESEGLSALCASSSDEALRLLASTRPALVLLDLRLGNADGRLVLQRIRADERLAQIPVFVISGAAESAAGFRYDGPERIDGFFEKPLNLPRLLDRVRQIVRAERASG